MIFKNTLESLEETPLKIQKTLTEITSLQDQNVEHYSRIDKFCGESSTAKESSLDKSKEERKLDLNEIKSHSSSFLKTMESEKKTLILLENLVEFLDQQIDTLEEEIVDFRESCATSAMMKRSGALDKVLLENGDDGEDDSEKYCYCKKPSDGLMVACDGEGCPIEWFHYECVGLTQPPNDKWFCSECSPDRNIS